MKKKGFTLIELLVVIAIIGILATIVVVVTRTARDSAKDSNIQGQLSQIRSLAEIYYNAEGRYHYGVAGDTLCDDTTLGIGDLITESESLMPTGTSVVCAALDQAYCLSAELNTGGHVCISEAGQMVVGSEACDDDDLSTTYLECN